MWRYVAICGHVADSCGRGCVAGVQLQVYSLPAIAIALKLILRLDDAQQMTFMQAQRFHEEKLQKTSLTCGGEVMR